VLAALGAMFYAKISTGTLAFYINNRFAWLSFAAVLIFALLALTVAYRLFETPDKTGRPAMIDAAHGSLSWRGLILVAIPALLGILAPARPLGADAIGTRGIGLAAPSAPGAVTSLKRENTGPRNILDWLRDFSQDADPAAKFNGQTVDVIGFVYRDERVSARQFWVSRFAVSCCVADANALGLLVQSDKASGLKTDSWVRVTGKFSAGQFAGESLPVIDAIDIQPIAEPAQPYLYP
jgi:uncharacterized repeat protein (TIGR03943 family)